MTDKEIIIDGVDVSRCEYRDWRNFCHCDNSKENEGEKRVTGIGGCKYNSDCYFKQLKRKEQALDDIEKQIKAINNECFYDDYECNNCDMRNGCSYYRKFKILNIIKKVKEK